MGAAVFEEIVAVFNADLFDRFEAVGGETGCDDGQARNAVARELHHRHVRIRH